VYTVCLVCVCVSVYCLLVCKLMLAAHHILLVARGSRGMRTGVGVGVGRDGGKGE
jgi:hypothetical protein